MIRPVMVKYHEEGHDEGFHVTSREVWEDYVAGLSNKQFPYECWFTDESSYIFQDLQEYLTSFDVIDISDDEAKMFIELFDGDDGSVTYGDFPWVMDDDPNDEDNYNLGYADDWAHCSANEEWCNNYSDKEWEDVQDWAAGRDMEWEMAEASQEEFDFTDV